tara:strand:- start:1471 stop:2460 length:990 start_codon:yes stop_codon:yes gene_type:complete
MNPQQVSPLLKHLPITDKQAVPAAQQQKTKTIAQVNTPTTLKIKRTESIHGGTRILELQAQCPFKAFGLIRLRLNTVQPPSSGINPRLKGIILHETLAKIWDTLQTQKQLMAQSDDQLENIITERLSLTLNQMAKQYPLTLTPTRCNLEIKRLKPILTQWLNNEKQRPSFRVIAIEKAHEQTIGPLTIKARIDRIDELDDGKSLLIDYKTGSVSKLQWLDDKQFSAQLPCYTQHYQTTTGIAFASIQQQKQQWVGISDKNLEIPGISTVEDCKHEQHDNWQCLGQHWQHTLTQLATNFFNGDIAINPRSKLACQTCDLQSVCRIKQQVF